MLKARKMYEREIIDFFLAASHSTLTRRRNDDEKVGIFLLAPARIKRLFSNLWVFFVLFVISTGFIARFHATDKGERQSFFFVSNSRNDPDLLVDSTSSGTECDAIGGLCWMTSMDCDKSSFVVNPLTVAKDTEMISKSRWEK